VRFEIFMAVTMKINVFYDVMQKAEQMQAGSSKMLVNLYHSTQCHIPKDNNLQDVTVYSS